MWSIERELRLLKNAKDANFFSFRFISTGNVIELQLRKTLVIRVPIPYANCRILVLMNRNKIVPFFSACCWCAKSTARKTCSIAVWGSNLMNISECVFSFLSVCWFRQTCVCVCDEIKANAVGIPQCNCAAVSCVGVDITKSLRCGVFCNKLHILCEVWLLLLLSKLKKPYRKISLRISNGRT